MVEILEEPIAIREVPAASQHAREEAVATGHTQDHIVRSADVYVLFTSFDGTLAALRVGRDLARSLGRSTVRLVDLRVVPIGAPVEAPCGRSPVEADGFLDRVCAEGIDVKVDICISRDAGLVIPHVFSENALIIIGGRRHWWPTRATRLRRMFEQRGRVVVFVDQDTDRARGSRDWV